MRKPGESTKVSKRSSQQVMRVTDLRNAILPPLPAPTALRPLEPLGPVEEGTVVQSLRAVEYWFGTERLAVSR